MPNPWTKQFEEQIIGTGLYFDHWNHSLEQRGWLEVGEYQKTQAWSKDNGCGQGWKDSLLAALYGGFLLSCNQASRAMCARFQDRGAVKI